jgi:predicted RecB family nuclease
MPIPVINVKGIGPITAKKLEEFGIITAEDLVDAGVAKLIQDLGYTMNRAVLIINAAARLIENNLAQPESTKKGKKNRKNKKDKKKKDKKNKKGKKDKKDKKKGKNKK